MTAQSSIEAQAGRSIQRSEVGGVNWGFGGCGIGWDWLSGGAAPMLEGQRSAERGEEAEACVPCHDLRAQRESWLDDRGVEQEREQRASVREGVEPPGCRVLAPGTGVPGLQQRAGRSQGEEGQTDRRGEQPEEREDGMPGDRVRIRLEADFQAEDRRGQHDDVRDGLGARSQARGQQVGVGVAGEQGALKEDQAGGPDRGGTAEERKQLAGGDRFEQKKEKRGEKSNGRVEGGEQLHPEARRLKVRPPSLYFGRNAVYCRAKG